MYTDNDCYINFIINSLELDIIFFNKTVDKVRHYCLLHIKYI